MPLIAAPGGRPRGVELPSLVLPRGAQSRNARVGGAFGILSGILVAAAFLVPMPGGTAAQQLANFDTRAWEFLGIVDVLILLTAIPFAAYLRSVLEGRVPGTASAAAILFVLGIAVGAGASVIQTIAIGTLSSTYTSASATAADRAAAVIAFNVLNTVATSLFPIVLLEAGIMGFSVAMLNSRIFPSWSPTSASRPRSSQSSTSRPLPSCPRSGRLAWLASCSPSRTWSSWRSGSSPPRATSCEPPVRPPSRHRLRPE